MKDTCKQAIFRKDTRRARSVEDPLRAGDQEEREQDGNYKSENNDDSKELFKQKKNFMYSSFN